MNYLRHFGLREPPFGITPDTHYFYACRSPQEALNTLLVAVGNGEGFIKITGEVGTGKTLLCRKFLATLGEGWVTAYVPNPNLDPRSVLLVLAEELGLVIEPTTEQYQIMRAITRALLDRARAQMRVVLCMDEAQAMSQEALETVRLLTNLETEKRKLLQVVLFGQPELDRKLQSPSLRQLLQRITFQHRLAASPATHANSPSPGPPLPRSTARAAACRASSTSSRTRRCWLSMAKVAGAWDCVTFRRHRKTRPLQPRSAAGGCPVSAARWISDASS